VEILSSRIPLSYAYQNAPPPSEYSVSPINTTRKEQGGGAHTCCVGTRRHHGHKPHIHECGECGGEKQRPLATGLSFVAYIKRGLDARQEREQRAFVALSAVSEGGGG
jgi:hypothetical protein